MTASHAPIFTTPPDLINFAHEMINIERLPSLKKDVNICINNTCPFPAILYCFSTIDLLGALYKGRISRPTENSHEYMKAYMKNNGTSYTEHEINLLQKIYRHKVVHVAQPKPVVEIGANKIAWKYDDENLANHLKLMVTSVPQPNILLAPYTMYFNQVFVISILKLAQDIVESVARPNDGYWDMLSNNTVVDGKGLQVNFEDAVRDIYDPKQ